MLAPLFAMALLAVSAAAAATALAADRDVAIRDTGFDPPTITVLTGEPVTWTNATSADHTVTTDDRTLDSGPIGPGEAYGHVFDTPGTFAYRDTGGSGFSGTVVVEAAPVTPRPSGSLQPSPPAGTLPPDFSPLPAPSVGGSSAPTGSPARRRRQAAGSRHRSGCSGCSSPPRRRPTSSSGEPADPAGDMEPAGPAGRARMRTQLVTLIGRLGSSGTPPTELFAFSL